MFNNYYTINTTYDVSGTSDIVALIEDMFKLTVHTYMYLLLY